jgi:hypothetical protein
VGSRRDPGTGIRWDPSIRPYLERRDERVLDRLLGEIEVAEDANERRDRPALLLPEQAVDELAGGRLGDAQFADEAPTGGFMPVCV